MNILEIDSEARSPEPLSDIDVSTISPSALKQIKKIIAEDNAQRKRNWAWWEELRKTDYPEYARTKRQMYRDADALGSAFFGEEE